MQILWVQFPVSSAQFVLLLDIEHLCVYHIIFMYYVNYEHTGL